MLFRRSTTFIAELFAHHRWTYTVNDESFSDIPFYGGIRFVSSPNSDPYPLIIWIGKMVQSMAGFSIAQLLVKHLRNNLPLVQQSDETLPNRLRQCFTDMMPIRSLNSLLMESFNFNVEDRFYWSYRSLADRWTLLNRDDLQRIISNLQNNGINGDPIGVARNVVSEDHFKQILAQELLTIINSWGYDLPVDPKIITVIANEIDILASGRSNVTILLNRHAHVKHPWIDLRRDALLNHVMRLLSLDLAIEEIEIKRLDAFRLPQHRLIVATGFMDRSLDVLIGNSPTLMELYELRRIDATKGFAIDLLIDQVDDTLRSIAARNVNDVDFTKYVDWWESSPDVAGLTISLSPPDDIGKPWLKNSR